MEEEKVEEKVVKKVWRWKGRMVTEKQYNRRLRLSEMGKTIAERRLKKAEEMENSSSEEPAQSNSNLQKEADVGPVQESDGEACRIVDLQMLAQQMWCGSCKECLSFENIENETRRGLASTFNIRCHKCLLINMVTTGRQHPSSAGKNLHSAASRFEINTNIIMGM